MDPRQKTILITGASGYFGAIAARFFHAAGWRVIEASRAASADITIDLGNPEDFARHDFTKAIDVCIHAAAAHEVDCFNRPYISIFHNVAGTKAALDFCVRNAIGTFVYLSTFHVFGNPSGIITETTKPTPMNDYGLSHLQAEQYVEMYGRQNKVRGIVVRPTNFFGIPADLAACKRWSLVPLSFCKEAVDTGTIILKTPGYQKRNFIAVTDICSAIESLLDVAEPPSLLHLFGQDTLSIRELALLIRDIAGPVLGKAIDVVIPDGQAFDDNYEYTSEVPGAWHAGESRIADFVEAFSIELAKAKQEALQ